MSSDNVTSFMKSLSLHVANINRLLHNTKSDVLVNYICSDNTGIMVITNKVAQQSDMSIIDQYVKNSNDINSPSGGTASSQIKIVLKDHRHSILPLCEFPRETHLE